MLASSRSASSWSSEYIARVVLSVTRLVPLIPELKWCAIASQSTIRAIDPSESTAPPVTAASSATFGGSGRVTSSRWPTSSLTASAKRCSCARTRTTCDGASSPRLAEHGGHVDEREHVVALDEHRAAGDRTHRVVGEAKRALDAVERDRERPAADLDEQRRHDRERQRQADLRDRALALLGCTS